MTSLGLFVERSTSTTKVDIQDHFTDRFTGEPIEGAVIDIYFHLETTPPTVITYLGQRITDETGFFEFSYDDPENEWFSIYIDFQHDDYLREYYEYIAQNQWKENHWYEGWTPSYTSTINGYVYGASDDVTVELWGMDDHYTLTNYGSTMTNIYGNYEFTDFTFDKEYPEIMEVPREYYIKVKKSGYNTQKIDLPEYPEPNGMITLPPVTLEESFPNGNFETGSLSPWTIESGSASISTSSYEGNYACQLCYYSWFRYYPATISQDLYIPFGDLEENAITCWIKSRYKNVYVDIYYLDKEENVGVRHFSLTLSSTWKKCTITKSQINLDTPDLPIIKIDFKRESGSSAARTWVDDIDINRKVEINGDFETHDLKGWETDSSYPAGVGSSYYAYSGSYGCRLASYDSPYYYATYVKQYVHLDVNRLATTGITFMMRSVTNDIKVTVKYTDGTSTLLNFGYTYGNWDSRSITRSQLASGKTIAWIKFERIGTSTSTTAIDDIIFHYT